MQAASIAASVDADMPGARTRISRSKLTEKDFAWLAYIRLIALAALAGRSGDLEGEQRLRTAFLKQQPLLFEPDHAVNFNLPSYQETLKPMAKKGGT